MRPIVTPDEMAAADRAMISAGTSELDLIERAGAALANAARAMLGGVYGRRVVVLAGRGNNGADGRVAARILRRSGVPSDVIDVPLVVEKSRAARLIARADLVIDAMYGTGLHRPLDGDAEWLASQLSGRRVLAADLPSGVMGATGSVTGSAVRAERTVCFQALKPGLVFEPGRSLAGVVDVVDLGIAVASRTAAVGLDDVERSPRAPDAHKWSASVLVVGGSGGMTGAPMLAARAALRSGAGMVVAALPGPAAAHASGSEVVTRAFPADPDGTFAREAAAKLVHDAGRFGAVVLGPGIGRSLGVESVVGHLTAELTAPIVIDADAIGWLARDESPLRVRRAAGCPTPIVTPHAGEYELLAGHPVGDDRIAAARDLAARLHLIVVLKGPGTVIAEPAGEVRVLDRGGSELATAGTGDVLAGVIGACLARGFAPFDAAWSAAAVHAAAGEMSGLADSTVASDVVDALPVAWSQTTPHSNRRS